MGHTSFQLDRRAFLKAGLSAAGALAISPAFFRRAFAAGPVTVGPGPYGPLQPFDSNGIALPAGFTSREIARGGALVEGSNPPYVWHPASDGQATFPTLGPDGAPDGGWILTSNSEMPVPLAGGVSGVEFAPDGTVERAYRVLLGTSVNCAGGPTPWGTWLSCEEHDLGMVHECDPTKLNVGVARPALGVFTHEAACVDPVREHIYLTEDQGDGCFYRFTPASYPDLSAGLLEVAVVDGSGNVTWAPVPDPSASSTPTREQVAAAARFDGGEGTWYDDGIVYFTTKGDSRVWAYDAVASTIDVLYDPDEVGPDAPLSGVDNITVSQSGDIFVCEDGRDHDICMITPEFEITRFLKLDPVMHAGPVDSSPVNDNETVGVVFNPAGNKMYFGAQRSFAELGQLPRGVVYEISGPFRAAANGGSGGGGGGAGSGGVYGGPLSGAHSTRLRTRKRRKISKFLRRGLPIRLDLSAPAGVRARLTVPGDGGSKTLGRAVSNVALNGRAAMIVKPVPKAAATLRGKDNVGAKLEVRIADAAGNSRTLRRGVRLWRPG